jgi:hypothetical protein
MMKFRRTAALALVGWYLLTPLADPKTGKMYYEAPLKYWQTAGSFDTAKECKQEWLRNLNWFQQHQPKVALDKDSPDTVGYRGAISALCIASDDPRLAK